MIRLCKIVKNPSSYALALAARGRRVLQEHRMATLWKLPVTRGTVLYEAYDGLDITCNPMAIFNHIRGLKQYVHFKHIWVIRSKERHAALSKEYLDVDNVSFVLYRSMPYFRALFTSQYLINNSTFPPEFTKKSDQIYLNTWHGIPMKSMGYDVVGGRDDVRNVVRNFLSADFLVSSGPFMTEQMYKRAFKLDGLFEGRIIEAGQPRVDTLLNALSGESQIKSRLLQAGLKCRGRKIVLYAPTWRGDNPYDVDPQMVRVEGVLRELQEGLGDEYLVITKLHQLAGRKNSARVLPENFVGSDWDTAELLAVSDHLVTDFSSICFDFLSLDRPIHFLIPDFDEYASIRGLYVTEDELPGSVNRSPIELVESILSEHSDLPKLGDKIESWKSKYSLFDDGRSTERVVSVVFDGNIADQSVIRLASAKKRILIHPGSLIPNGITTAAINLISRLDHSKYDVTVIYPYSSKSFQRTKAMEIDERARLLPRIGSIALGIGDRGAYWSHAKRGGVGRSVSKQSKIERVFQAEWRRCVGISRFDIVIGFDGYQVFWSQMMLESDANNKFLWAHNDLLMDANRRINDSRPHFDNLHSVFPLYAQFDRIVSVTPELKKINAHKLGKYAESSKFVYVRNFVDHEKIRTLAGAGELHQATLGSPKFVTVGRLSPEKDQARILRSFARVIEVFPAAFLTIVGDGPLMPELRRLASELGLLDNVEFAGLRENPFPFMKNADCFVFASKYEGQGLALLESLVLEVPVISTRFNVVEGVLSSKDGLIVDPDDRSLASALIEFCHHGLAKPSFDVENYNLMVHSELIELLSLAD